VEFFGVLVSWTGAIPCSASSFQAASSTLTLYLKSLWVSGSCHLLCNCRSSWQMSTHLSSTSGVSCGHTVELNLNHNWCPT